MTQNPEISFGTDGWRAIIGESFTYSNVRKVSHAIAQVFLLRKSTSQNKFIIAYDTRFSAGSFARAAAEVFASHGFEVELSSTHAPTPALCKRIADDEQACGGICLTASHNPAEYLGIKVRMEDGGASPVEFTALIEAELEALAIRTHWEAPAFEELLIRLVDFKADYFVALLSQVDEKAIIRYTAAHPEFKILVDPLYGAGREFNAELLSSLGIPVEQIHCHNNPGFNGLHPEPIPPWTDKAAQKIAFLKCVAAFITDGDGDRLGALDEQGKFVSPHQILALIAWHLHESRGQRGRIIKTLSTSVTVDRLASALGLESTTTPIGFKWIYAEMLHGDVMIGGEESGGIGIPSHVKERDALLMALLLIEMMVVRDSSLSELVEELEALVGKMYYARRDLKLSAEDMKRFVGSMPYIDPDFVMGKKIKYIDRRDGIKFHFADDEWLLLRPSGTEPLVRVYAELNRSGELKALIDEAVDTLVFAKADE